MKKDIKFSHSELLESSRDGLLNNVRSIISKYALDDVSHVRGLDYQAKVLGKKMQTDTWNPFLHAIYNKHLEVVKFMANALGDGPTE